MAGYTHDPKYDDLPELIKNLYSPKDYAWLPDDQKRNIVSDNCMPELHEDD